MNSSNLIKIISILFVFLFASCQSNSSFEKTVENKETATNVNSEKIACITEKTAILIAKGFISSEYDPTDYEPVVSDNGIDWKISFPFKPKYRNSLGGQPTVIIDKKSGEVVNYVFPK